MRIITGGIQHETHSFSAEPTTADTFPTSRGEECWVYAGTNHSLGGVIDGCRERGIDVIPTILCDGVASGPADRDTFDRLVGELVERIGAALPADGVVLTLHGAMAVEGAPDAEGEIVRRVRAVVGAGLPIAVTLDYHANIGQMMVDGCQIVTTYHTYPHIDANERGREAVALLVRTIAGEIRPTIALAKPPLLPVPQAQFTARPPFQTLLARAHAMETSGEALSVTVAAGFPYADVPDAGVGFLVTTNDDRAAAQRLADELAQMAWGLRRQMLVLNVAPAEAVAQAIAHPDGPVVLVDVGDNIGGGTPGDGTILLAELLRQGAQEATIVVADNGAVEVAFAAGVGGEFAADVGGKTDRLHGDPMPVRGRVRLLGDGEWTHEGPEQAGVQERMGRTAVVRVAGINLVLTSIKSAPGDLQQLKSVGIDPTRQKIIVVKAAVRWRGGYAPITKHSIDVDTPGLGSVDLARFPFRQIRRPIFPLDPDTAYA